MHLQWAFQDTLYLYLIFPYYGGGDLFYHMHYNDDFIHLRNNSVVDIQNIAKYIIAQIILAINHLHSLNIIYRSCKPEDILFDKAGYLVLTDFASSKQNNNAHVKSKSLMGPLLYLAPEVLMQSPDASTDGSDSTTVFINASSNNKSSTTTKRKNRNRKNVGQGYDDRCDWWSLGVLMYEIIHGVTPFMSSDDNNKLNRMEIYENILSGRIHHWKPLLAPECKSLIEKFVTKYPEHRLSDFSKIKKHVFFGEKFDWNGLQNRKIKMPFIPSSMHSEIDVINFDRQFTTAEPILPVPSKESMLIVSGDPFIEAETAWDYPH